MLILIPLTIYFLTHRCSHGNSTCCFSCQTFKMAALTYTVRQWQQKRAAHTELFISAAQALPWHRTRFRWIKDPQGAVPTLCSAASSMSDEKHTYRFTSWATGALAGQARFSQRWKSQPNAASAVSAHWKVLPVSCCYPVFSPVPSWQQQTPGGGFVSGAQWRMRGYDLILTVEMLGWDTNEWSNGRGKN